MGDLNAYGMEDPVVIFTGDDKGTRTIETITKSEDGQLKAEPTDYRMKFVNLGKAYGEKNTFSYTYKGEAGSLDHVLASPSLATAEKIIRVYDWNINAAEPKGQDYSDAYYYDREDPKRHQWKPEHIKENLINVDSPFRSSDHNPLLVDIKLGDKDTSGGNGGSGVNTGDDDSSGSLGWLTLGLGLLGLGGRRRKKKAA